MVNKTRAFSMVKIGLDLNADKKIAVKAKKKKVNPLTLL
jgi:hypothetical protein